ncbi:Peptidase inhibitor 15-A [Merluccius polli]|uniref:Peptidase inhibitor 15-A n=1 Tax=Merluccius polli TaxID=89951 RepID=A0AA47M971_MERPO|nr:Peptidase inhibitor 15-A [Merluccius polli]
MTPRFLAVDLLLLVLSCGTSASPPAAASNSSSLPAASSNHGTETQTQSASASVSVSRPRKRRYISQNDMLAILDYHNKVRGKVFPPASNMEYMVWDESLAKTAEDWAHACLWEHGPQHLLRFLGQNLSVRTGRIFGCSAVTQ